jgi:hypothetical protein
MTFSIYKYKEYNNDNGNDWSIQPPTIDNWCDMVNKDREYCKKFNLYKWMVLYYHIYFKSLKTSELPSYHPYWMKIIKNRDKKKITPKVKHKVIKIKYKDAIKEVKDPYFITASGIAEICNGKLLQSKNWISWEVVDGKLEPFGTIKLKNNRFIADINLKEGDDIDKILSVVTKRPLSLDNIKQKI